MYVGEAAKAAGVGIQTLHFYEGQRLISRPPRSRSGYRLYTPEIVEQVRFIRKAQALGFSLDEIREILDLARKGTSPCGRVQAALAEKMAEVDRRLEELRRFRVELASLIKQAHVLSAHKNDARVCSIVEEAPALPLTSITRPKLSPKGSPRRQTKKF